MIPASTQTMLPYKSVAVALIFSVILGPVGLLYSSYWGGFVMILLGVGVVSSKMIFPIILIWLVSCVWAVGAVEHYNQKLIKSITQTN